MAPRLSRQADVHRVRRIDPGVGAQERHALPSSRVSAKKPAVAGRWPVERLLGEDEHRGEHDQHLSRDEHVDQLEGVERENVMIELSPAQVDRVIRTAVSGGSISLLLSGLKDVREVLAHEPSQLEDNRLSRSLLAGLLLLASFPTDGTDLGNAEIARLLDMNPSTTHRYVSTLVAVGLLERDPTTRRYRLA
jgi:hypothetical protein